MGRQYGYLFPRPSPSPAMDFLLQRIQCREHDAPTGGESGRIAAKPLWRLKAKQFESEQHTPLFFDGHLYGVRTKAGGEQLVCLDLNGKEAWNSGSRKFGRGPYMIANGLLLALADNGLLTMAEATHESFRPLGQFQVFDQAVDAWAPMAFASGRLLLRDLTRLSCIHLTSAAK